MTTKVEPSGANTQRAIRTMAIGSKRARQQAEASAAERVQLEQFLETARDYQGTSSGAPIVLRSTERMLATVAGVALIEPRRGPGQWQGRSQGLSVHVPGTKSMRYRVGASRGTFVQGEERPTPIDTGAFTLTTTRAVFAGGKQTREWAWGKLISVTHASDAPWTAIAVSNRQKTSGVAYGNDISSVVRFWIDLAVATATGGRREFVADLEAALSAMGGAGLPAPPAPMPAPPQASVSTPAQWGIDPFGRHELRWWDGQRWTDQVSSAGRVFADPPG